MSLTNSDWATPDHPDYNKPTPQAERAREIKELYVWWTDTYRNRPDPHDASGWTEYCKASRIANNGKFNWATQDKSPELKKMSNKSHKLLQKIEAAYEAEDEAMLIRLVRIRNSLWT
jgi:hypothetical protein